MAVVSLQRRLLALCPAPYLEDQVSVFMSPSDKMAHLHHQALGSLFIAFYDLQGYGGSILTHLHTRKYNQMCRCNAVNSLLSGGILTL
jgi:hypothetical protein